MIHANSGQLKDQHNFIPSISLHIIVGYDNWFWSFIQETRYIAAGITGDFLCYANPLRPNMVLLMLLNDGELCVPRQRDMVGLHQPSLSERL